MAKLVSFTGGELNRTNKRIVTIGTQYYELMEQNIPINQMPAFNDRDWEPEDKEQIFSPVVSPVVRKDLATYEPLQPIATWETELRRLKPFYMRCLVLPEIIESSMLDKIRFDLCCIICARQSVSFDEALEMLYTNPDYLKHVADSYDQNDRTKLKYTLIREIYQKAAPVPKTIREKIKIIQEERQAKDVNSNAGNDTGDSPTNAKKIAKQKKTNRNSSSKSKPTKSNQSRNKSKKREISSDMTIPNNSNLDLFDNDL